MCKLAFLIGIASTALAQESGQHLFHHARFTVITRECIRLEYNNQDHFIDDPSLFAFNRQARFIQYRVSQTATELFLDTGKIQLRYRPDGHAFAETNLHIEVKDPLRRIHWHPGQKNAENLGGTLHSLDHVAGFQPLEPGLLSRDGWFVLDDGKRHLLKNDWVAERPRNAGLDWYFFGYGADFHGALKSLTAIGGAAPLPRKYVLGAWYSRWWPYTSQDYRNIVSEFHAHDFPLDMVVMDMDWHKTNSWTGYSWNKKLFPDGPECLRWLHSQGLHATLNDHPQAGVGTYEDSYANFMGALGQQAKSLAVIPYNAGDKHYLGTVFSYMHHPLEDAGVDFWWLDWMGDDKFPLNTLDWVNEFYYRNSERKGLRGQQFSRWADWGDHRHPIHFSGDTHIAWSTLQFEVPFTSTAGNVGAFYWSHDIGGFEGLKNGELLARWTQFGAFTTALRLHSINRFYLDKRPWIYSSRIENSMRVAFHLRSELFPYTYSTAWQAYSQSMPLVRPLYLHFPYLEEAYHHPEEYFYGDNFLVIPVTRPSQNLAGTVTQNVWLPPGVWYDFFSGQKSLGDRKIAVTSNLEQFPLFVRGGAPIVMQPYRERMTSTPLEKLRIKIFPGAENKSEKFSLYEDDGESPDYLKGRHGVTTIETHRRGSLTTIQVTSTEGQYQGQLAARSYRFELPYSSIKTATLDGVPILHHEKEALEVPVRDIRKPMIINVESAFPFDVSL